MNPVVMRSVKNRLAVPVLIAALGLILTGRMTAQTFTTLHNFDDEEGANPYGALTLSGNTLYGAAAQGGSAGVGTVFSLRTDGTAFTNLHNFAGHTNDGAWPYGSLILSGDTLYGTTQYGGGSDNGAVFAVGTDGTG